MVKANSLFDKVTFVSSKAIIEKPTYEDDGKSLILAKNLHCLDDGNEVIECLWTDSETYYDFWEIDLYQKEPVYKTVEEVTEYFKSKGFYIESVSIDEDIWRFARIRKYDNMFRLTYYCIY